MRGLKREKKGRGKEKEKDSRTEGSKVDENKREGV